MGFFEGLFRGRNKEAASKSKELTNLFDLERFMNDNKSVTQTLEPEQLSLF